MAPAIPGEDAAQPVWTGLLVESLPASAKHRFLPVTVTGYCSLPELTDDTPHRTAIDSETRPGTLALSRDLLRRFTPGAPFDFGDRVLIPGMGIYIVEDTMHPRWNRKADIWFHDIAVARRWGVRQVYLSRVEAGTPVLVAPQWHS
jgi:3D (Asp-Asp-Asp) domain-containing protein